MFVAKKVVRSSWLRAPQGGPMFVANNTVHAVEFARVVRFSAPEPESPVEIEVGAATVRVRRGVDRATLDLVLDALEAREIRTGTLS